MEQIPQSSRLPYPTHGTKASNHPTLMSNPWNKGFKLSDSHVQPMEQRPQTIQLPHTTHGTKTSNWHLTPMYNPWNFQPHQMMTAAYCTLALHHCSFIFHA